MIRRSMVGTKVHDTIIYFARQRVKSGYEMEPEQQSMIHTSHKIFNFSKEVVEVD